VLVAAVVLPLAGAALALTACRPAPLAVTNGQAGGVVRAALGPGAALMLVNVGYVALLAFGESATGCGLLVPVFAAGVIVIRAVGAWVPDRLGARRTAVAAAGVAAAGLLALSAVHGTGGALASTAVIASGQALAVPALGLLVLARAPAERQGAAAGLFFAFFDAGVGAGGLLTGLAARATSPSGALVAASGAVACAGLSQAMMRGDTTRAS
jgi:predicted MFS family arabinose efflux permease